MIPAVRSPLNMRRCSVILGLSRRCAIHQSYQVRNKSWYGLFSAEGEPKKNDLKIIVEEDVEDDSTRREPLRNIRHISKESKRSDMLTLAEKFKELVHNTGVDQKDFGLLNSIYIELYKFNKTKDSMIDNETIDKLMEKTISTLLLDKDLQIPEYLSILIRSSLESKHNISDDTLVKVILLLTSRLHKNSPVLGEAFAYISKSGRQLSNEFIDQLIERLGQHSILNLRSFELMHYLAKEQDWDLGDNYYKQCIEYIESLYEKKSPKVHEYRHKERNIFRVQEAVVLISKDVKLEHLEMETAMSLLKLMNDLCLANHNVELETARASFLDYLSSVEPSNLTDVFLRQDSEDMLESFVSVCLSERYTILCNAIFDSILLNPLFYTPERILQARAYLMVSNCVDENEIMDVLESLFREESKDCTDLNDLFYKWCQVVLQSPHILLTNTFNRVSRIIDGIDVPLKVYKLYIDVAVRREEHQKVIEIFQASLKNYVSWMEESGNVIVMKTMNDVVISGCKTIDKVEDLFVLFNLVKQHMNDQQMNVYTITELSRRMLDVEYVGDCIEMLNRELKSKTKTKVPLDDSFFYAYKELFNQLHEFVTSYTKEETYETNWALYKALHSLFQVPYDSFLPAMQFFCQKDRLNASLVIFKKVIELSETRANIPAPLKEMYIYLMEQFGDKLYKEGVEEVHEHLKLDVALPKQDLVLQNSILNAYCNLQEVGKVRELFLTMNPMKELVKSDSSIDEDTAKIMIKAYTYSDLGLVKSFWNNLSSFGVFPNYDVFRQYLIAHVYHGFPEEAIELTTTEMEDYGIEMTEDTVAALYNYCLTSKDQDKIEKWAEKEYPKLWALANNQNLLTRSDDYQPETSLLVEGSTEISKV